MNWIKKWLDRYVSDRVEEEFELRYSRLIVESSVLSEEVEKYIENLTLDLLLDEHDRNARIKWHSPNKIDFVSRTLRNMIDITIKDSTNNRVKASIEGEAFIDKIINRINNKQLGK